MCIQVFSSDCNDADADDKTGDNDEDDDVSLPDVTVCADGTDDSSNPYLRPVLETQPHEEGRSF